MTPNTKDLQQIASILTYAEWTYEISTGGETKYDMADDAVEQLENCIFTIADLHVLARMQSDEIEEIDTHEEIAHFLADMVGHLVLGYNPCLGAVTFQIVKD